MKCLNTSNPQVKELVDYFKSETLVSKVLDTVDYIPSVNEFKNILDSLNNKLSIKPGVAELFESNPELANKVYEALGFKKVYHGSKTTEKYLEYKTPTNKGVDSLGSFFTSDLDGALMFTPDFIDESPIAKDIKKRTGKITYKKNLSYVKEEYLKLQNPYKIDIKRWEDNSWLNDFVKGDFSSYNFDEVPSEIVDRVKKILIDRGHDGIYIAKDFYVGNVESKYDQYIVFDPNKILKQQKQQAQQLYSQYLDTIFPDSKVKDIVYRGGNLGTKQPQDVEAFTTNKSYAEYRAEQNNTQVYHAILNIQESKLLDKKEIRTLSLDRDEFQYQDYGFTDNKDQTKQLGNFYTVKENNRHILGSKQDIEGFKEFVQGKQFQKLTAEEKAKTIEQVTKEHRSITALKDLSVKLAWRIGGKVEFDNRTDVDWKGYNQGMVSVLNEAYMTPDTPFHEVLAHPIIRALKNLDSSLKYKIEDKGDGNYWVINENNENKYSDVQFFLNKKDAEIYVKQLGKYFKDLKVGDSYIKLTGMFPENWTITKKTDTYIEISNGVSTEGIFKDTFDAGKNINKLYQSLLKELETGRGKEIFEQVKRDYKYKEFEEFTSKYEGRDWTDFADTQDEANELFRKEKEEYQKSKQKYNLEEQQEEAIVTLLGMMAADKLDAKQDATLISKLKELWEQISDFVRQLLLQDEIRIDELPITTTLNDLAEIMAYGNNKIILPGYKVEYSTPLGNKYDTLEEVNNEIRKLADADVEIDLNGVKLNLRKPVTTAREIPVNSFTDEFDNTTYNKKDNKWYIEDSNRVMLDDDIVTLWNSNLSENYIGKGGLEGFIEKNKEYEQSKEIIEEYKKINNIQYDPEEVYSRGQGFYSSIGAYSNLELDLLLKNLIQHIQDNKKAGGEFTISAFTKPIDKRLKHIEGTGDRVRFVIYPQSEHIKWAAPTDVYSGSVWDAHEKVSKDKKSELLGVSFTKAPALRNINKISPNLADIIDNLSHAHNELGIELTTNNFRIEYDDNIDYSTKKLIDNINKILDDKYGKLEKPEVKVPESKKITKFKVKGEPNIFNTREEAQALANKLSQIDYMSTYVVIPIQVDETIGKQPTQTKENTTSIESVKSKIIKVEENITGLSKKNYPNQKIGDVVNYKGEQYKIIGETKGDMFFPESWSVKPEKEYINQAEINLKVAALKEVARKYPRSLITSKVVPINSNIVDNGEIQYSKVASNQAVEGVKEFVNKPTFNKELAKKIQDIKLPEETEKIEITEAIKKSEPSRISFSIAADFDFIPVDKPTVKEIVNNLKSRLSKVYSNYNNTSDPERKYQLEKRIEELKSNIAELTAEQEVTRSKVKSLALKELNIIKERVSGSREAFTYAELVDIFRALTFWSDTKNMLYDVSTDSDSDIKEITTLSKDLLNQTGEKLRLYLVSDMNQKGYQAKLDDLLQIIQGGTVRTTINSVGKDINKITQYLDETLRTAQQQTETNIVKKLNKFNKLISGLSDAQLDLIIQRDSEGNPTYGLTNRYSQEWFDEIASLYSLYRKSFDENGNITNKEGINSYFDFINNNTVVVDSTLFLKDKDGNYTSSKASREKEYARLKNAIGTDVDALIEESLEKYELYLKELENIKEYYEVVRVSEGLSVEERDKMVMKWQAQHDPASYMMMMLEKTTPYGSDVVVSTRFVLSSPKRFMDGKETKWFDSRFDSIRNNSKLWETYKFIETQMEELRNVLPGWQKVPSNFLFNVSKKSVETIFSNGLSGILPYLKDKALNTLVTNYHSTINDRKIDSLTGEPAEYIDMPYVNVAKNMSASIKKSLDEDLSVKEKNLIARRALKDAFTVNIREIMDAGIRAAEKYKQLSSIENKAILINKVIQDAAELKLDAQGNAIPAPASWITAKGGAVTVKQSAKYAIDAILYDKYKKEEGLTKLVFGSDKEVKAERKKLRTDLYDLKYQLDKGIITKAEYDKKFKETNDALIKLDKSDTKGKNISYAKSGDALIKLTQVTLLGWSPFSAVNEIGFGFLSNIIHAAGEEDFSNSDMIKSFGVMLSVYKKLKLGSPTETGTKITNILDLLGVVGRVNDTDEGASGKWSALNPFALLRNADFFNKGMTTVAMLLNEKLENGQSLYDAILPNGEFDLSKMSQKDVEKWVGTDNEDSPAFAKLRNKIRRINEKIHNNEPSTVVPLKRTVLGRLVAQFKLSWMANGIDNRFGPEYYDNQLEREVKGRYKSYATVYDKQGGFLGASIYITKNLFLKTIRSKMQLGNLTTVDEVNMKRNLAELQVLIGLSAVIVVLKNLAEGDDDDDDVYKLVTNVFIRLRNDNYLYANPTIFKDITRSLIPAITYLDTWQRAITGTIKYITDEDYRLDDYLKRLTKPFPVLNNYNRYEWLREQYR